MNAVILEKKKQAGETKVSSSQPIIMDDETLKEEKKMKYIETMKESIKKHKKLLIKLAK